jgi:hypothetical protein
MTGGWRTELAHQAALRAFAFEQVRNRRLPSVGLVAYLMRPSVRAVLQ